MMSFDRRKCKVLQGPEAPGQHCPEGWTVYKTPGPTFQGAPDDLSTDMLSGLRRSGGVGTDRRPECRMEGSRALVEPFDVHALAPGRRQRLKIKDCEIPGPSGSTREIAGVVRKNSVRTACRWRIINSTLI